MKLFACVLSVLLPGVILTDTEVCPNRPAIENLNCNSYKGHWFPLMRTGGQGETKCQEQIIEGGGDDSATIIFKFTFLNGTALSYEGTIRKPEPQGKMYFSVPNLLEESTYTVLATDYTNYAVIDMCWKFNADHHKDYVSVMGRSSSLSPEALAEVDAVLQRLHVDREHMFHYSHEGCAHDHHH